MPDYMEVRAEILADSRRAWRSLRRTYALCFLIEAVVLVWECWTGLTWWSLSPVLCGAYITRLYLRSRKRHQELERQMADLPGWTW